MTIRVLNPTSEAVVETMQPAPRLKSLAGKTVGLISNGKEGTAGFFAHLDRLLRERYQVAQVVLRTKSDLTVRPLRARSSIRPGIGIWLLLASVTEAAARRAVCMTRFPASG